MPARRHVKVLASRGTDTASEDKGRQAQARTLTEIGINSAIKGRVQRETDRIAQEMARINDACVIAQPIPLEARKPKEAVGATQPFNAREALCAERESFTLEDVMAYLRDATTAFSSAFLG